jgi:hypothetical protein
MLFKWRYSESEVGEKRWWRDRDVLERRGREVILSF